MEVAENIVWLWMVLQKSLRLWKDLDIRYLKVEQLVLGDQWRTYMKP